MKKLSCREEQGLIWDYYKPRHTHAWNMLVLSWRALEEHNDETSDSFETEYAWENFIIRLWLYRATIKTLTKLIAVADEAQAILRAFDSQFSINNRNGLKSLRDMIEHFDDYAAGKGRGPAKRESDLDPWRKITRDRYERGQFFLERRVSYNAAIQLRTDAKSVSEAFITWYKTNQ